MFLDCSVPLPSCSETRTEGEPSSYSDKRSSWFWTPPEPIMVSAPNSLKKESSSDYYLWHREQSDSSESKIVHRVSPASTEFPAPGAEIGASLHSYCPKTALIWSSARRSLGLKPASPRIVGIAARLTAVPIPELIMAPPRRMKTPARLMPPSSPRLLSLRSNFLATRQPCFPW